jgi:hypothetical protein
MLDPYAPGSGDEDEPVVDLSRDLSSDPMYDFAAHGWTWVDGELVPPKGLFGSDPAGDEQGHA